MIRQIKASVEGKTVTLTACYTLDVPFEIRFLVDEEWLDFGVMFSRNLLDAIVLQGETQIGDGNVRFLAGALYVFMWLIDDDEDGGSEAALQVRIPFTTLRHFLLETHQLCAPNNESNVFQAIQLNDAVIEDWCKTLS